MNSPRWTLACGALMLVPLAAANDAADLGKIAPEVLGKEQRQEASGMIERDIVRRTAQVNARNREEWAKIKTREQWEKFRDERIARLTEWEQTLAAREAAIIDRVNTALLNADGDGWHYWSWTDDWQSSLAHRDELSVKGPQLARALRVILRGSRVFRAA